MKVLIFSSARFIKQQLFDSTQFFARIKLSRRRRQASTKCVSH